MKFAVLGLLMCLFTSSLSWRVFHLGRKYGGNLNIGESIARAGLPPVQWFEQNLDHFNPTDARTWKQVCK